MNKNVAIIYQAVKPPERGGIIKPMKEGGYSDSGADIAYALQARTINVITPVENPEIEIDKDWVFPDTREGICSAIDKGANVIWLNTVLYEGHPIEEFLKKGVYVVGQIPRNVDRYDDKWLTNSFLRENEIAIPNSIIIEERNRNSYTIPFLFPVVVKPIRGRGSQGVSLVKDAEQLENILYNMFDANNYGNSLYVEEFLPGNELTITIMPPGNYKVGEEQILKENYWSLPPVKRFNHQDGIAPYNGVVAVVHNSKVISVDNQNEQNIEELCNQCEKAAELVEAKSPIRIDCRADNKGNYFLFDLNMKPNMTGASRPHRNDQDSLTTLAAREIGWSFGDLVENIINQYWK